MFKEIFLFEFKYGIKKISTWVFFALFFFMALTVILTSLGFFDLPVNDSLTTINSSHSNTDYLIATNANILGLVNSIILITIIATAIQKDYQYNFHSLMFTKPISKAGYFFGRFLGAFSVAVIVFLGSTLGLLLGAIIGQGNELVGPILLENYLMPFLIFVLPNIFLQGVIYFSLSTYFRSSFPAYLFAIIILVLQVISSTITADIDNSTTAALLDINGQQALEQVTKYWSAYQMNNNAIPFADLILYNRLLWIGVALIILLLLYRGFKFSQAFNPIRLFKKKEIQNSNVILSNHLSLSDIVAIKGNYSLITRLKTTWHLIKFEMNYILKSYFYLICVALGVFMLIVMSQYMGSMYGSSSYPLTYQIVSLIQGSFSLFALIFIVFYSGTMVWRDRESKIDELIGVTSVSNPSLFVSKWIALTLSATSFYVLGSLLGICLQISKEYYHFEWSQYVIMIVELLIFNAIVTLLCVSIQYIITNKYLGFFIALIPLLILNIALTIFDVQNPLFYYNSSGSSLVYSDMNEYGGKHFVFAIFKTYWFAFTGIIAIIAIAVMARGKEKSILSRLRLNKYNNPTIRWIGLTLCVIIAGITGYVIYRERNIVNSNISNKEMEKLVVDYEKSLKPIYGNLKQPRIIDVNLNVDIFPDKNRFEVNGRFLVKNKTNLPIDTLFIDYSGGEKSYYSYKTLAPSRPFVEIFDSVNWGTKALVLTSPLQPGDTMAINLVMSYEPNGIFRNSETTVVHNGTFFNNMSFFSLGYNEDNELSSNASRKKYGLPEKERMAAIDDSSHYCNTYISRDADWINFETTVSTNKDQIAIAPGYLQKDWEANGRKYFHYKMDSPILNFYSFLSAKYAIKQIKWNDINIEVYYHPTHTYNIDRMIDGVKDALAYYTTNFSPYQHKQVRILEFPRYASFAQSFPNTIPFSESMGFTTHVEDKPEVIDMPYYVTAHEVAHQWFAHQVIGADVQGSVLMSESLSQYGALMVMEKKYGAAAMRKFLKYEMDEYLTGRARESKKEVPLLLVENQPYIHYRKGSVVFYALKEYLGEKVLNQAIQNYIAQFAFQEPPYTNARDFYREIQKVTPDSLQYLITDLFEKIALYENYVIDSKSEKLADGTYQVTMNVGSAKFYSNASGMDERSTDMNDYIEIGVLGKPDKDGIEPIIQLRKVKMNGKNQTVTFITKEEPYKVGIDPMLKLIDRNPENNLTLIGAKPAPPKLTEGKEAPPIEIKL